MPWLGNLCPLLCLLGWTQHSIFVMQDKTWGTSQTAMVIKKRESFKKIFHVKKIAFIRSINQLEIEYLKWFSDFEIGLQCLSVFLNREHWTTKAWSFILTKGTQTFRQSVVPGLGNKKGRGRNTKKRNCVWRPWMMTLQLLQSCWAKGPRHRWGSCDAQAPKLALLGFSATRGWHRHPGALQGSALLLTSGTAPREKDWMLNSLLHSKQWH